MSSYIPAPVSPKLLQQSTDLARSNLVSARSISDVAEQGTSIVDDAIGAIDDFIDDLFGTFDNGFDGFLENLVESSGGQATAAIQNLADQPVPPDTTKAIINDLQNGKSQPAAEKLEPYSNIPLQALEFILNNLEITLAGTVLIDSTNNVLPATQIVTADQNAWSGMNTQGYNFSYVSSIEELEAEMRSITREVTEVIVHWTDSYTNKNLIAQQIHDAHVALGIDGIGYHYIIRRDGSLQRGRPVNIQGEHTSSHDQYSIAIAFVGGFNCPTETDNPVRFQSSTSLTRQQYTTFDIFVNAFYKYIPGGQVMGHNDVDIAEVDPGFDVIDYCRLRFGKDNIFTNPAEQPPLSRAELNLVAPI